MLSLKSAITIFSKANGMACSHIRNFSIKIALTKTFSPVPSENSPSPVTPSCVTNDEIHAKKLLQVRPKTNQIALFSVSTKLMV